LLTQRRNAAHASESLQSAYPRRADNWHCQQRKIDYRIKLNLENRLAPTSAHNNTKADTSADATLRMRQNRVKVHNLGALASGIAKTAKLMILSSLI
jgi:hypothetical protein